mgnify:CR=1 FL=1
MKLIINSFKLLRSSGEIIDCSKTENEDYFKILPAIHNWSKDKNRIKNGIKVPENFLYSSDKNGKWMTSAELAIWIEENIDKTL